MTRSTRLHVALTTPRLRDGELVVEKRRLPLDEPLGPSLRAEAERRARHATEAEARWLVGARHPGVVALRHHDPDRAVLATAWAGAATVAHLPPGPGRARALSQVAATLGRIHLRGLVHGAVRAEHIVVATGPAADLRARLCSPRIVDGVGDRSDRLGRSPRGRERNGPPEPTDDLWAVLRLVADAAAETRHRRTAWRRALVRLGHAPLPRPAPVDNLSTRSGAPPDRWLHPDDLSSPTPSTGEDPGWPDGSDLGPGHAFGSSHAPVPPDAGRLATVLGDLADELDRPPSASELVRAGFGLAVRIAQPVGAT